MIPSLATVPKVHICQKLWRLVESWQSYRNEKRSAVFGPPCIYRHTDISYNLFHAVLQQMGLKKLQFNHVITRIDLQSNYSPLLRLSKRPELLGHCTTAGGRYHCWPEAIYTGIRVSWLKLQGAHSANNVANLLVDWLVIPVNCL